MNHNQYDYSLDIFEKETKKFVYSFFYEKKKRKVRWIAAVLLVPVIILANSFFTKASVSYYYSPLCLGSWVHVKNVEGEPQLALGADASEFNNSNSAILKNSGGQIYCGNFQTNDNGQNELKSLKLKFSITVIDEGIQQIKTDEFQNGGTLDGNYDQGAVFIIQNSNPGESTENPETSKPVPAPVSLTPEPSSEVQLPEPKITPEIEKEQSTETPAPTEQQTIIPEPTVSPTESPVSIFKNIFSIPIAVADENTGINDSLNLDDLIDAKYSYDGENWNYLGRITRNNWKDVSFDLPVNSADQVFQLQISLSSLPMIDSNTSIYIDSIWLEAEYESGIISFVKDISETIFETVTLQNLTNDTEVTPFSESKETKPVKIKEYNFDIGGSEKVDDELEWYTREDIQKLEKTNKKDRNIDISTKDNSQNLVISGSCEDKFYVILLYRNREDYSKNPSSAVYNSAFECDGTINHWLETENLTGGDYWLLIGEQRDTGTWIPVSDLRKISLEVKEVEIQQ